MYYLHQQSYYNITNICFTLVSYFSLTYLICVVIDQSQWLWKSILNEHQLHSCLFYSFCYVDLVPISANKIFGLELCGFAIQLPKKHKLSNMNKQTRVNIQATVFVWWKWMFHIGVESKSQKNIVMQVHHSINTSNILHYNLIIHFSC